MKNIIDEGDELVSVKLIEKNKLEENIENKKRKPVYSGYDDSEFGTGNSFFFLFYFIILLHNVIFFFFHL